MHAFPVAQSPSVVQSFAPWHEAPELVDAVVDELDVLDELDELDVVSAWHEQRRTPNATSHVPAEPSQTHAAPVGAMLQSAPASAGPPPAPELLDDEPPSGSLIPSFAVVKGCPQLTTEAAVSTIPTIPNPIPRMLRIWLFLPCNKRTHGPPNRSPYSVGAGAGSVGAGAGSVGASPSEGGATPVDDGDATVATTAPSSATLNASAPPDAA